MIHVTDPSGKNKIKQNKQRTRVPQYWQVGNNYCHLRRNACSCAVLLSSSSLAASALAALGIECTVVKLPFLGSSISDPGVATRETRRELVDHTHARGGGGGGGACDAQRSSSEVTYTAMIFVIAAWRFGTS